MPASVIGKSLQLGYPGSDTRSSDQIKVNRLATGNIVFGVPVVLNGDNTVSTFGASNTAAQFLGIASRIVKQQTDIFNPMGGYRDKDPADVLVRGSVAVVFKGQGTPTAGGAVYIRIAANALIPEAAIGDIEAQADGTNTLLLDNLRFTTGQTDASGVIEVTVLERRI